MKGNYLVILLCKSSLWLYYFSRALVENLMISQCYEHVTLKLWSTFSWG